MNSPINLFLYAGLFFPVLSLITLIFSILSKLKTGKYSSPVFIPLLGPFLINVWLIHTEYSKLLLIVPWISDVGTIWFLIVLPRLLKEFWNYSDFTKILSLSSVIGNSTAVISFHKNGHYIIRYKWLLKENETGTTACSDIGTYENRDSLRYLLTSSTGIVRELIKEDNRFICKDKKSEGIRNLDGRIFC